MSGRYMRNPYHPLLIWAKRRRKMTARQFVIWGVKRFGISEQYLYRILACDRTPSAELLVQMHEATKHSPRALVHKTALEIIHMVRP